MLPKRTAWVGVWLVALFTCAACGNQKLTANNVDSGASGDAAVDRVDATAEGGALRACLEAPNTLARPPERTLPCELIPGALKDYARRRRHPYAP